MRVRNRLEKTNLTSPYISFTLDKNCNVSQYWMSQLTIHVIIGSRIKFLRLNEAQMEIFSSSNIPYRLLLTLKFFINIHRLKRKKNLISIFRTLLLKSTFNRRNRGAKSNYFHQTIFPLTPLSNRWTACRPLKKNFHKRCSNTVGIVISRVLFRPLSKQFKKRFEITGISRTR